MKKMKWISRALFLAGCFILQVSFWKAEAHAAGTLYESPYVTFSPDGKAWTTNQDLPSGTSDGRPVFWYSNGYDISTGILSDLRELREGEHYYGIKRQGEIPVGSWKVVHTYAQCIHRLKQYPDNYLGGIEYSRTICGKPYFSGWVPYCADCGERITGFLHYMSKEAAASINSIDVSLGYYYLCPSCNHLEQGVGGGYHVCKQISYNKYKIEYNKNVNSVSDVTGYTDSSFHMYNNEMIFEGQVVIPNTHLTLNGYQREGYYFLGWNTEPDGTGTFYADGAEIRNLSTENFDENAGTGIVTLYAQWKRTETNLVIDPNGGSYEGREKNTILRQQYGTAYVLNTSAVIPPKGYTVNFEVNGGECISPEKSIYLFEEWHLQEPANGLLIGEEYKFFGKMNDTDIIKVQYLQQPVTLPQPEKANVSFGGWYRDPECTEPVGGGGELFIPAEDTTLYAKWVELVLYAENNHTANGGKGAVDLSWTQADGKDKTYKLYQSVDGVEFKQIYDADEAVWPKLPDKIYSCEEQTRTVTIPYNGFYNLTASGAQGGDYGEYEGGKGGTVTGKFYLKKGEILTLTVGGQNGFNGGGEASTFGNGGGYTIISSDQKGTLLIAGGGGGATSRGSGGDGGGDVGLMDQEPSLSGNSGENGYAGGGGGHCGGQKGTVQLGTAIKNTVTYSYAGRVQKIPITEYGLYRLEVWGASGNGTQKAWAPRWPLEGTSYARGGYASGFAELEKDETLYLCTGGRNGYNGGGAYGGGGATHIALNSDRGVLKNYENYKNEILIVAGGGGNSDGWYYRFASCDEHEGEWCSAITTWMPGAGGGLTGGTSVGYDEDCRGRIWGYSGAGGTQVSSPIGSSGIEGGGFGQGGIHSGGGWYGGNAGPWQCGSGGSSYIGSVRLATKFIEGNTFVPTTRGDINDGYGWARITQYENISEPSYGGSSYINTEDAITYEQKAGDCEGDGRVVITSLTVGFQDTQSLDGISAPDLAAPDVVRKDRIELTDAGDGTVRITWKKPSDNGTTYYHEAESYEAGTEFPLCVSNITKNTLVSGIAGYYYVADNDPDTSVTAENARNAGNILQEEAVYMALGRDMPEYLHLAVADVAGNISATTHICLNETEVAWQLFTEELVIGSEIAGVDYGSIYPANEERTWYVRADASTPFLLIFDSYMVGRATENYQINYQLLNSCVEDTGVCQRYCTKLPYTVPLSATGMLDAGQFIRKTEGSGILNDAMYVIAERSGNACRNRFLQAFTLKAELHGKTIQVTPEAGADFGEKIVYSDRERDSINALRMIADGEGPAISGLEVLSENTVIDRGSRTVQLCVRAEDEISGVRDFYLKISNSDNYGERTYFPDETGVIRLDITEEDALFTGDFVVTAHAEDHVGNVSERVCPITEFSLETRVERILEPHTPVFKRGESGILYITTRGYADRVEVEFPEELTSLNPDLNKTVTYTALLYQQDECLQFMIPLYAPENGNYRITVRAYKGDKRLEEYPSFSTVEVEGSILDELRTRLR